MSEDVQSTPLYEEIPEPATQPFANAPARNNRRWVGATWNAHHAPGESPKASGGYEVDGHGNPTPARGFNRPDQRYQKSPDELRTSRQSRAVAELPTAAIVQIRRGDIGLRTATGNNYHITGAVDWCDCPDAWRLRQSYPTEDIACKHRCMALLKMDGGGYAALPLGCARVAELAGCENRTVENACRTGSLPAYKVNQVWHIAPADAATWVAAFQDSIVGQEGTP